MGFLIFFFFLNLLADDLAVHFEQVVLDEDSLAVVLQVHQHIVLVRELLESVRRHLAKHRVFIFELVIPRRFLLCSTNEQSIYKEAVRVFDRDLLLLVERGSLSIMLWLHDCGDFGVLDALRGLLVYNRLLALLNRYSTNLIKLDRWNVYLLHVANFWRLILNLGMCINVQVRVKVIERRLG